jgi:DNA-directed RNA polymerase specialized sigma24 family protein
MIQALNKHKLLSADELSMHIIGCTLNKRESQKKIYEAFYGYAIDICNRYNNGQEDLSEILNDGFLKIFKEIYLNKPANINEMSSFVSWLEKIMVRTVVDHIKKKSFALGRVPTNIGYDQSPSDGIVYQF